MSCKPIYEFLLWDNCNNNCKFCFQRELPRLFSLKQREQILNKTIDFINSDNFLKGSHILVVGGEIFDKPTDFNILYTFFEDIINKMLNDDIEYLYLNTNLLYKDLSSLYRVLTLLNENSLLHRLKFTTSYDFEGRFKTKDDELLMLSNLEKLKWLFPNVNIVVNMILTDKACEYILNDKFDFMHFRQKYDIEINLLPYIIYDYNLSAPKEKIFKTLQKIQDLDKNYIENYIKNFDLNQDKLLFVYKNDNYEFCSCEHGSCGHSINFRRYSTENTCFVCDLKEFFNGK